MDRLFDFTCGIALTTTGEVIAVTGGARVGWRLAPGRAQCR